MNPEQYWQDHLNHCREQLEKASTPGQVASLERSIARAEEQLRAIANGTYQPPEIFFTVIPL